MEGIVLRHNHGMKIGSLPLDDNAWAPKGKDSLWIMSKKIDTQNTMGIFGDHYSSCMVQQMVWSPKGTKEKGKSKAVMDGGCTMRNAVALR